MEIKGTSKIVPLLLFIFTLIIVFPLIIVFLPFKGYNIFIIGLLLLGLVVPAFYLYNSYRKSNSVFVERDHLYFHMPINGLLQKKKYYYDEIKYIESYNRNPFFFNFPIFPGTFIRTRRGLGFQFDLPSGFSVKERKKIFLDIAKTGKVKIIDGCGWLKELDNHRDIADRCLIRYEDRNKKI